MRERIVLVLKQFIVILWKVLALCVLLLATAYAVFVLPRSPSNNRDWMLDQQILPEITFTGDMVHIKNIRNFVYTSTTSYTPRYYDRSYNLTKLTTVDFIVEPFDNLGAAHTFLSFGFEDDSYITISVEIRKEIGESFGPLKGLFRNYELMYVIGDERDTVLLRSNHRKDAVYLYPIKTTKENMRILFVDMLTRAKKLQENPEFYNTITNTCTTNIVEHVNTLVPNRVPFDFRLLFPEDADVYAYELGLIDTSVSLEALRATYQINDRALQYADDPEFSLRIRGR